MKYRNFAQMRIFLLISFIIISVSGFSQNPQANSTGWGNQLSDENNISLELRVYPNPSTDGKVTIELNNQEITEIRLTNITGKEVFLKKFQFAENKKQIQFNDIPNGLYIIRIITSDQKQVMKKLMLTRN
jgi:hypothetical protein